MQDLANDFQSLSIHIYIFVFYFRNQYMPKKYPYQGLLYIYSTPVSCLCLIVSVMTTIDVEWMISTNMLSSVLIHMPIIRGYK